MSELVLVGCSGSKLDRRAPARHLYTSPLFRLARSFAEAREAALGSRWAILSAKHGLVLPDEELDPYDVTFRRLRASREALARWARDVRTHLDALHPVGRVVFLAGADYRRGVEHLHASRLREPLSGLGIGKRLRWLRRQVSAAASAPAA